MNQNRMNNKTRKHVASNNKINNLEQHKNKYGNKSARTKRRGRNRMGGEALASGGFGCIFKPALKCKGTTERTEGVSKMSIEKHGKQEMNEIERIKAKLEKIKKYQKYYLLDVTMCNPDKLTHEDMKHFDKKCYALTRHNINEKNVNNRLDRLTILNMPNAGIDLKDWLVEKGKISRDKMFLLNDLVVNLIKFGVRPMNEAGVIHNDLKDRNIMVDSNMDARIIDWGLSGVVKDGKIPVEIMNRPLQFNTPFSSMMLSEEFKMNYDVFLQRVKDGLILFNRTNVRNYVINEYLIKLARYYGYYDDNVILFKMIFSPAISDETFLSEVKKDNLIEYGYYLYYLSNYITDILMKFTSSSMEFDMTDYFMKVYLFNSDIFGLMTVYYNFFEVTLENIDLDEETKQIYLNRLRSLLVEHIYSNGGEKIDINKLTNAIKDLNEIINYDNKLSLTSIKRNYSITKDLRISPIQVPSKSRSKSKSKHRSKSRSKSRSRSKSK
jgi:serine/threonine protein kinase